MPKSTSSHSPASSSNPSFRLTLVALLALIVLAAPSVAAASTNGNQPSPAQTDSPLECAPARPIEVTASRAGDNLVLSWPSYPENWYYEIHQGTTPYFTPNQSTLRDTVHAPNNTWTSTSALLTNGDDYFLVKAQGCAGDKVTSNRVASFAFPPELEGITFGDTISGEATYYWEANGGGNCMFPPTPDDVMVAAVADYNYGPDARLCGAYARVQGPYGEIQVRIVDRCPDAGCYPGHLDLHPEAFEQIAPMEYGRVNITWQLVSPPVEGDIEYHFKDGSSRYWSAIQVRNHRNPLARFEVLQNGSWTTLPRQEWNYFLAASGLGSGPYTFRVTDVFGNQIVTRDVPLLNNATYPGGDQFPPAPE